MNTIKKHHLIYVMFIIAASLFFQYSITAKAQVTSDIDLGTNVTGEYDDSTKTLTITSDNGTLSADKLYDFLTANNAQNIATSSSSTKMTITNASDLFSYKFIKNIKLNNIYIDAQDTCYMFEECISLENLELTNFDTSKVTDMSGMFSDCNELKNIDLSGFNTANVVDMGFMFYGCTSLQSIDLSSFDTSKVTSMAYMFCDCSNLKEIDVSNFNTSKVTDLGSIFHGCSSIQEFDVSNFNTSGVIDMQGMFYGCKSIQNLDLSNFNTANVKIMKDMFSGCTSLKTIDLSNFDTSNVTNMEYMFMNCKAVKMLDLSNFETSKVTDMTGMFFSCDSLELLDISSFVINNGCKANLIFESTIMQIVSPKKLEVDILLSGFYYKGTNNIIDVSKEYYKITAGEPSSTYYYKALVKEIKCTASDMNIEYDGLPHSILVSVTEPRYGYSISYSQNGQNYSATNPVFTEVGEYTVYYKVDALDYFSVEGSTKITITQSAIDNATIALSNNEFIYDGTPKIPAVVVQKDGISLSENKDYFVSYANNTAVGTATVTVYGKGNYCGSKSVGYVIKAAPANEKTDDSSKETDYDPKNEFSEDIDTSLKTTSVNKISADKKAITVTWKRQGSGIKGYEIQYSTDKKFSQNVKSVFVNKAKTTSKTIKKLKSGKKYFIRIRTFKKKNGKKVYSKWSAKKSAKVK